MYAISEVDGQSEWLGGVCQPVGQPQHSVPAGQARRQVESAVQVPALGAAVRR